MLYLLTEILVQYLWNIGEVFLLTKKRIKQQEQIMIFNSGLEGRQNHQHHKEQFTEIVSSVSVYLSQSFLVVNKHIGLCILSQNTWKS